MPYAIDFMNPAPDADYHSVGAANFEWIVERIADLAIQKAQQPVPQSASFHWSRFLSGGAINAGAGDPVRKGAAKKATEKRALKTAARKTGKKSVD